MNPAASTQPREDSNEALKETFESIVIAFILAFVFRSYVVEAFVIPTGSMAPTLLGEHVKHTCSQCGYAFNMDIDASDLSESVKVKDKATGREDVVEYKRGYITRPTGPNDKRRVMVTCPMCHNLDELKRGTRTSAGDRILVFKYIYSVSEPRRWDVVVFKAPHKPHQNYIKRLVGLPHEELLIVEGNVYVRPVTFNANGVSSPAGEWRIARKTDSRENRRAMHVQRAVWQPIYHSSYVPMDGGKRTASDAHGVPVPSWELPWVVSEGAGDWQIAGQRSYRFDATHRGVLSFDFDKAQPPTERFSTPWYAYNHLKANGHAAYRAEPIEDVRLALHATPEQDGLSVQLETTARIEDDPLAGPKPLRLSVLPDGGVLLTQGEGTLEKTLAKGEVSPPRPGVTRSIELWFVDQHAIVWIDGRIVIQKLFDLSMKTVRQRLPLPNGSVPRVKLTVSGSPVTLTKVQLDRDLYYSSSHSGPGGSPGYGALSKDREDPALHFGRSIKLEDGQFFVLGDNSPMSQDSRYWPTADSWIDMRNRPTTDRELQPGVVPRSLMMGRAFFVYFPSPLRVAPDASGFFPNFGRMRVID